jgi:hypothetical protein
LLLIRISQLRAFVLLFIWCGVMAARIELQSLFIVHISFQSRRGSIKKSAPTPYGLILIQRLVDVDVSYAALQAHGIVNVALHRQYSPGIVFIFSQGRNDPYHV